MTINKTYGDAAFNLSWSGLYSYVRVSSSDTSVATVANGGLVTIHGAGTTTLTKTHKGHHSDTLVVAKASQAITGLDSTQSVSYATDLAVPNLPTQSNASLAVTYASSDDAIALASGSTVTVKNVGTVTLTASQAGNGDYNAAPDVEQALTIVRAAQDITFDPLGLYAVGAPPFEAGATASSGLAVSYDAGTDPSVATVISGVITPLSPGTTSIGASQAGNDGYYAASNVTCELTVFAWSGGTVTGGVLTDVTVDFSDGTVDGEEYVSALDDAADGDHLKKHALIDVPDYYGTGTSRTAPRSYLQLGAYPTAGSAVDRGDDMLEMIGLVRDGDGYVATKHYIDDWRDSNRQQHSDTTYHRDKGTTAASWAANAGNAGTQLTKKLLSRGGWRDHTDGNRVITTRGDRVDVIGGNYRMVVFGRRWNQETKATNGWGYSYWESSGGHNKDATNTPGEVVNIAWDADSWQVVDETIKGDTIERFYGVSAEYFTGPSITSCIGADDATAVDIPASEAAGSQQQTDQKTKWLNPSPARKQINPTITETVHASTVTSDVTVKDTISDTTTCSGTHTDTTTVGSGVTIASYVPKEITGAPGTAGDGNIYFKDRLHAMYTGSREDFSTKTEAFAGDVTLKAELLIGVSLELSLSTSQTVMTGGQLKASIAAGYGMEVTMGAKASASVGFWLEFTAGVAMGTHLGPKYEIRAPLRASCKAAVDEAKVAENRLTSARLKAILKFQSP